MPLTCHWYCGPGPGFWPMAVNVTDVPRHTGFAETEMLTETGRLGTALIWMTLEVAGLPVGQE